MQRTFQAIDITACVAQRVAPTDRLRRLDKGETWLVAVGPIEPDKPVEWATVSSEDYVHIPLVPYQTSDEPSQSIAFAFSIGLMAFMQTRAIDPIRLHLAYGNLVERIEVGGGTAFRIHLGLAVRIK